MMDELLSNLNVSGRKFGVTTLTPTVISLGVIRITPFSVLD